MLKVGDMVKVIENPRDIELFPLGTIGEIIDISVEEDGKCYEVYCKNYCSGTSFWYDENELEKGHLEWIKED